MDIIKIGGSKINKPELFSQLINYITNYSSSHNNSAFFIISAFDKNTKDLKKCLELSIDKSINNYISLNKKDTKQKKRVQQILNQIYNFHLNLINNLILSKQSSIFDSKSNEIINELINTLITKFKQSFEIFLDEINETLQNVSYLNLYSAKTLDRVISYGEVFAFNTINYSIELSKILNSNKLVTSVSTNNSNDYISTNYDKINLVSAFDFVTTNDTYNNAFIDEKQTFKKLSRILDNVGYNNVNSNTNLNVISNTISNKEHFTFITQGFIAKSEKNEITTMGMESSNLTAAVICKFFNSKKLNIITDTKGVYNCDPRVFSEFNTLNVLDYNQSIDLSKLGLKLLYKQMLQICKDNDIEITYSSIFEMNNNNIIKTTISNNSITQINCEPVFIVNFNLNKCSFSFDNLTDFENHIKTNTFGHINFFKQDNINLSINYYTYEVSNLINKEEVTLLTIYKFSKINNEFFDDELLKGFIDFIEIDYKNNIVYLIINKIDNTENETYIFDKIKSYFS